MIVAVETVLTNGGPVLSRDKMLEVASRFGKPSIRYLRKLMIYATGKTGTQKEAAQFLGIPYSTFRRWSKTLKLNL